MQRLPLPCYACCQRFILLRFAQRGANQHNAVNIAVVGDAVQDGGGCVVVVCPCSRFRALHCPCLLFKRGDNIRFGMLIHKGLRGVRQLGQFCRLGSLKLRLLGGFLLGAIKLPCLFFRVPFVQLAGRRD